MIGLGSVGRTVVPGSVVCLAVLMKSVVPGPLAGLVSVAVAPHF